MNREPVLDPMLVQCVSILEDLACEDQDQLILLSLKPPGDFLLELLDRGLIADQDLLLVLGGLDGDPNLGPRLSPTRLRIVLWVEIKPGQEAQQTNQRCKLHEEHSGQPF